MGNAAEAPRSAAVQRAGAARLAGFLVALVVVDALLIGVNVSGPPALLDLDQERNFPTWYSSAKLLLTALAALACRHLEPASLRRGLGDLVWPTVALIFTALSIDETATVHERLAAALMSGSRGDALRIRLLGGDAAKDAFVWPVLFAPIIVVVLSVLTGALYARMRENRRSLRLGLAGCASFVVALLLEGPMVYLSPPVAAWGEAEVARYVLFTVIEESAELLGATLMLASLLLHARHLDSGRAGDWAGTTSDAAPGCGARAGAVDSGPGAR